MQQSNQTIFLGWEFRKLVVCSKSIRFFTASGKPIGSLNHFLNFFLFYYNTSHLSTHTIIYKLVKGASI